ncbi:hypothetical protein BN1013_01005 [Candidatus Rubidus massiliensis]|nr:hypothetical protein BN1013_01005 [Candidatus Rubidus massiliensis]
MLKKCNIIFLYVFLLNLSSLISLESINALASLCHYSETVCNESDIEFSDDNLLNLWSTVFSKGSNSSQIHEAYQAFLQARHTKSKHDFKTSYKKILSAWKTELNDEDSNESPFLLASSVTSNLEKNPYISNPIKRVIAPYILPEDHPTAPILDALFSSSRATQDKQHLINAGFKILHSQPRSFIKVVSHPQLAGYLLKVYTDNELRIKKGTPGWEWFVKRCYGARRIKNVINKYNIKHFVVAKKWIYPLPAHPSPPHSSYYKRQICVLLVTDMQLIPSKENYNNWRKKITKKHLDELYLIISHGNGSSYRPDNVHFTYNNTIAFIDTEYPDRKPNFSSIRPYLSDGMKNYWDKLISQGGPR